MVCRLSNLLVWLPLALLLTGCATNPVTGRYETQMISEQQEVAMGTEMYPKYVQMQGGEYILDPALTAYVRKVGRKVVRVADRNHLPYEFVILNAGDMNAWALPGGKIAINRGLLLELHNEAELAAVLAHEAVHAAARHSAKQMERGMWMQLGVSGVAVAVGASEGREAGQLTGDLLGVGAGLATLKYSRSAESEADHYSLEYLVDAGYNPEAAATLQETFVEKMGSDGGGWLASHPGSGDRAAYNRELAKAYPPGGYRGEAEYRVNTAALRKQAPAYEHYQRGVAALGNGDTEQALQAAMEARRREPREAHFYGLTGMAYEQMGNQQAALKAYGQAIERNRGYFAYYLRRGLLHQKLGRKEKAIDDLRASWELLPTEEAQRALKALGAR